MIRPYSIYIIGSVISVGCTSTMRFGSHVPCGGVLMRADILFLFSDTYRVVDLCAKYNLDNHDVCMNPDSLFWYVHQMLVNYHKSHICLFSIIGRGVYFWKEKKKTLPFLLLLTPWGHEYFNIFIFCLFTFRYDSGDTNLIKFSLCFTT